MSEQYGDYVVHTDELPEEILEHLLERQVHSCARELGLLVVHPFYSFNTPYTAVDPETGESISGFLSAWKFTVDRGVRP